MYCLMIGEKGCTYQCFLANFFWFFATLLKLNCLAILSLLLLASHAAFHLCDVSHVSHVCDVCDVCDVYGVCDVSHWCDVSHVCDMCDVCDLCDVSHVSYVCDMSHVSHVCDVCGVCLMCHMCVMCNMCVMCRMCHMCLMCVMWSKPSNQSLWKCGSCLTSEGFGRSPLLKLFGLMVPQLGIAINLRWFDWYCWDASWLNISLVAVDTSKAVTIFWRWLLTFVLQSSTPAFPCHRSPLAPQTLHVSSPLTAKTSYNTQHTFFHHY